MEAPWDFEQDEYHFAYDHAKARLSKLTVRELRILFKHYYPYHAHQAAKITKACLIDDLVELVVEDKR
jgi:hypothetical protein